MRLASFIIDLAMIGIFSKNATNLKIIDNLKWFMSIFINHSILRHIFILKQISFSILLNTSVTFILNPIHEILNSRKLLHTLIELKEVFKIVTFLPIFFLVFNLFFIFLNNCANFIFIW